MTTAETTSAPPFDPSLAESGGGILRKWVAPFAVAIALLSAFLTFMVLSGLTPIEPTRQVVYSFLLINAATILLLVGIIVREVWLVIQARRRGRAAARLHVQIVSLFSIIAVLPAVLVAIVANVTIDRGLDRLFSGPTREVMQNSLIVARAYLNEHAQLIRGDILGMANDLARARPLFDQDRRTFRELLTASATSRNLPGAMLIDKDRNILETAQTGTQRAFPIRRLMSAANLVSTGDLHVQVPVHQSEGDLAQLGETFNKMTQELRTQRDDLVNASDLIDSRRRFIEAVLSSASAGIIGVDASGSVGILNRSAEKLIGHAESETLDHPLSDVLPELDEMMKTAREGTQRLVQGQITITRDGQERNLSVRVSAEQTSQSRDIYIITLDDITELVSAQRTSAWGDVARRIAHEIKNPLTPIQLSAERIRRKFGKVITEDKGIFEQCTDTIVRQVDDIRRMVDEFSRFARMPKPVMEGEDVADTVRQAVFLMKVGHPDLDIEADIKQDPMRAQFDRRLISQALTNIIKNATEAIEQVPPEELGKGRIDVVAARENDDIVIDVIDNGIGLPKVSRARLLEPYVTTRQKGTGLGLAIVGRVLEDHGGRIELKDASDSRPGQRGAWMRLRFAVSGHAPKAEAEHPSPDAKPQIDETKAPSGETNEAATATNDQAKTE